MQNHEDDDRPLRELTAYELIDWMDSAFPPRTIERGESETDAHRYAGRRELVDELLAVRKMEQEEGEDDEDD